MRLGIFGGTFDPVHYGHLLLAECCREQCRLDQVWLLPAAAAPHKLGQAITPAPHRVEMLQLAIGGHEAFFVHRGEIDRGGVSYTVETLATIRAERPDAELFFLLGADSLRDFPTWREPARICDLATIVAVHRAGVDTLDFDALNGVIPVERIAAIRAAAVEMPRIDLSSRDLRARIAAGRSIRFRTPRAVEAYIATHALYRATY